MKPLLAALALAPMLTGPGTEIYDGMPPARFRGNGSALTFYVADVSPYCGKAPPGYVIYACEWANKDGSPIIALPDPRPYGDVEFYARIVCHELAHARGWSEKHEL